MSTNDECGSNGTYNDATQVCVCDSGWCGGKCTFKGDGCAPTSDICGDYGCGNHGTCNYETYICDCDDSWSGGRCTIPPPEGTACQPSDTTFIATFGGDLSCGNLGVYGTCQANGLCMCPTTTLGTRCQEACDISAGISSQCGGPDRGSCGDLYPTCTCVDGWAGNQCKTPPSTPCVSDSDCGWGGTINGACESLPDGTKTCACVAGYYGSRCERQRGDVGEVCEVDDDCTQPQCSSDLVCSTDNTTCCADEDNCGTATCVKSVCAVSGTTKATCGGSDLSNISLEITTAIEGLLSPEGISMILINEVTDAILEKLVVTLTTAPYKAYLTSQVNKLIESTGEEEIAQITEDIFIETATNIIARSAAEDAALETVNIAVDAAAELVRGILGSIMDIVTAIGMVGMVLDSADVAGFSGQVNQDYLDLYVKKVLEAYNTNDTAVEAGISYPFEVPAYWDVAYQTESLSDASTSSMINYTLEYVEALQVNSEGDLIEFTSDSDQTQSAEAVHNASTLNKFLWGLSAGNEDVFQRWLKYWWVMVIALVVMLLLLIVPLSVYSAKVHKRAKHNPKVR